ncbi:MAG TPA: serine/threonine-protein kinase [Gemmataceae bacterium]|jgi:serine/threonine protein kinase|nr:serine/threonine-protein kinase [Gemmataceae bacterium]
MIGETFGRWVIDKELGKGAMGSVYRAHAADAPEEVRAIKLLATELARDPTARQRFERETEVLCHLDHPNIVRFDGADEQHGTLYYVMEFIDGPDCETRLREQGRWPWFDALDLAIQVTRGLKYAHDQGIVHRDLKPANILISDCGFRISDSKQNASAEPGATVHDQEIPNPKSQIRNFKIADFGVARMFSQGQLTGSGHFVGTALYMAPEQAAGKPASKRSDFYSLGCVLYTLLAGRPPFNGTSIAEMVHKHQFVQPERLSRLLVDLPHDIDDLVMILLSKDPAQRPADGSVLLKRLESIRGKLIRKHNLEDTAVRLPGSKTDLKLDVWKDPVPKPEPAGYDYRGLVRLIIYATLLLLCVAGIVWAFVRPRPGAEELFAQAQPLMASNNPNDWEKAWNEYLEPLTRRYPDHAHRAEVDEFRRLLDDVAVQKRLSVRGRLSAPHSEAQRFYELGLARCQAGDVAGGRRIWEHVVLVFGAVESERRWVLLSQRALTQILPSSSEQNRFEAVEQSLALARQLRDSGNPGQQEQARQIWQSLEELYRDDPAAKEILDTIKKDRGK